MPKSRFYLIEALSTFHSFGTHGELMGHFAGLVLHNFHSCSSRIPRTFASLPCFPSLTLGELQCIYMGISETNPEPRHFERFAPRLPGQQEPKCHHLRCHVFLARVFMSFMIRDLGSHSTSLPSWVRVTDTREVSSNGASSPRMHGWLQKPKFSGWSPMPFCTAPGARKEGREREEERRKQKQSEAEQMKTPTDINDWLLLPQGLKKLAGMKASKRNTAQRSPASPFQTRRAISRARTLSTCSGTLSLGTSLGLA